MDTQIMDMISNFNLNYKNKRMYYVRYVGDFIIGIQGSHSDALTRVNHLKIQTNLKLQKIRHFASESIHFLGIKIGPLQKPYKTPDSHGRLPMTIDLNGIFKRLRDRGFVKLSTSKGI